MIFSTARTHSYDLHAAGLSASAACCCAPAFTCSSSRPTFTLSAVAAGPNPVRGQQTTPVKLVFDVADDIVILNSGRVVVDGSAADVKANGVDLRQHLGIY